MKVVTTLNRPVRIGKLTLRNRLFRAPLLEGAGVSEDGCATYMKHFVPNAQAGVGLIIQGTTCVTAEGRPSPGMTAIDTRVDMMALEPMTRAVHQAGSAIIIQLGHGGIHCIEGWHNKFKAERKALPLAVSSPGIAHRLITGKVHVMSTAEVKGMVARFGLVARWAREAGYDGVEIAGANGKMMHQFFSRTYNRRTDEYGGTLENRTRFLREIRAAIMQEAGDDFPVTLKFPALEEHWWKGGITLEEGLQIARIAEDCGYDGLTPVSAHANPNGAFCRGDFPQASFENKRLRTLLDESMGKYKVKFLERLMRKVVEKYPFEEAWNLPIFSAVKQVVSIPVSAVGGIRTREAANKLLGHEEADVIGVGRPFYTDPDLARMFLKDESFSLRCNNCNRCILPQLLGHPGVCYNPASNRKDRLQQAA